MADTPDPGWRTDWRTRARGPIPPNPPGHLDLTRPDMAKQAPPGGWRCAECGAPAVLAVIEPRRRGGFLCAACAARRTD